MGRRAVGPASVLRGEIWLADVGLQEAKRFVIVSNNERNRSLRDVLGVRMTTAPKPSIASIVEFRSGQVSPERTFAVADDIVPLRKSDLIERVGGLTLAQMQRVEAAIRAALALD
jgi:mRNA-degrading endonuclease toxin of MazEF toxin-antitoxin module